MQKNQSNLFFVHFFFKENTIKVFVYWDSSISYNVSVCIKPIVKGSFWWATYKRNITLLSHLAISVDPRFASWCLINLCCFVELTIFGNFFFYLSRFRPGPPKFFIVLKQWLLGLLKSIKIIKRGFLIVWKKYMVDIFFFMYQETTFQKLMFLIFSLLLHLYKF